MLLWHWSYQSILEDSYSAICYSPRVEIVGELQVSMRSICRVCCGDTREQQRKEGNCQSGMRDVGKIQYFE